MRPATPVTATPLDGMLRGAGIETVVAAGISLNVGIVGLGYHVVVSEGLLPCSSLWRRNLRGAARP